VEALQEENGIYNAQPFFSALERLQPEVATHGRLDACWCGIAGDKVDSFTCDDEDSFKATLVLTKEGPQPVHVKRVHLVDPIQAIEGECVWPREGALPAPSELWLNALDKINDPMNEAYVDAVFALFADRMVSSGLSPHWCRCYGTFPARVEKYMYNISEEYPSFRNKSFWTRNQRLGLFRVQKEAYEDSDSEDETRTVHRTVHRTVQHNPVVFLAEEEIGVGDFEVLEDTSPRLHRANTDLESLTDVPAVYESAQGEEEPVFETDDTPLVIDRPAVRIRRIQDSSSNTDSEEEEECSEEDGDSEESDHMEVYAEFSDFPVQVILLERVEGTLDELLDMEFDEAAKEAQWSAWTFQIIAALSSAQYWFGFVHNDLHSQNVMWSRTDKTHIVYRIQNTRTGKQTYYRIPTYGYVMKIIDFGRASFTLPEPAGFFISDAFFPGNDAALQYNCDPFYDGRNGKKVEPNPSFDLCRLAISMLESLWPTRPANSTPVKIMSREGPKTYAETTSPLYNLLWEWLTDDAGKNMLRCPNGDERYPEFDLYSAIAADVHRAVPHQQIEKSIFTGYRVDDSSVVDETVYDLYV
jgi:serine/threonine protein kinase